MKKWERIGPVNEKPPPGEKKSDRTQGEGAAMAAAWAAAVTPTAGEW
jgi:hypothetical protein